jgi:O-antigen ligase
MGTERFKIRWLLLALAVLIGTLMTGTRSTIVFVMAPLFILVFSKAKKRRVIPLLLISVIVVTALYSYLMSSSNLNNKVLESLRDRIQITADLISNDSITNDLSYMERINQTKIARREIQRSPIIGAGAGKQYEVYRSNRTYAVSNSLDTPLYVFAKYGIAGFIVLMIFVISIYKQLIRSHLKNVYSISLIAFLGIMIGWYSMINPFDDKGSGLSFILLFALAINSLHEKVK